MPVTSSPELGGFKQEPRSAVRTGSHHTTVDSRAPTLVTGGAMTPSWHRKIVTLLGYTDV